MGITDVTTKIAGEVYFNHFLILPETDIFHKTLRYYTLYIPEPNFHASTACVCMCMCACVRACVSEWRASYPLLFDLLHFFLSTNQCCPQSLPHCDHALTTGQPTVIPSPPHPHPPLHTHTHLSS